MAADGCARSILMMAHYLLFSFLKVLRLGIFYILYRNKFGFAVALSTTTVLACIFS